MIAVSSCTLTLLYTNFSETARCRLCHVTQRFRANTATVYPMWRQKSHKVFLSNSVVILRTNTAVLYHMPPVDSASQQRACVKGRGSAHVSKGEAAHLCQRARQSTSVKGRGSARLSSECCHTTISSYIAFSIVASSRCRF